MELVQTSSMAEMAMMYIALMVPLALTQSVTQAETTPLSLKQAQAAATGEHSIVMALT